MNPSPSRKLDMQARANMLYAIEVALRHGDTETAKAIGVSSARVADRIRTKDYSQEDAWLEKEREILGYNPK